MVLITENERRGGGGGGGKGEEEMEYSYIASGLECEKGRHSQRKARVIGIVMRVQGKVVRICFTKENRGGNRYRNHHEQGNKEC